MDTINVMRENKIEIVYLLDKDFTRDLWIKSGEFDGYIASIVLDLDTPEKRQKIVAAGWEDIGQEDAFRYNKRAKLIPIFNNEEGMIVEKGDFSEWEFDHFLTEAEAWTEIARYIQAKTMELNSDDADNAGD